MPDAAAMGAPIRRVDEETPEAGVLGALIICHDDGETPEGPICAGEAETPEAGVVGAPI